MSVVDQKLADLNREIAYWKGRIVTEMHNADRLLDRLQLHLRERDHLLSLTQDERDKADELWRYMDSQLWQHRRGGEFDGEAFDAAAQECSMILDGAA